MCLVLPARVVARGGDSAQVELHDGQRVAASLELAPQASIGDFVLVDRGLILRVIEADEAQALLAMYAEIGELLDAEEEEAMRV